MNGAGGIVSQYCHSHMNDFTDLRGFLLSMRFLKYLGQRPNLKNIILKKSYFSSSSTYYQHKIPETLEAFNSTSSRR